MMDDEDPHVAAEDSGEGERAMDHRHQRHILERNDIEAPLCIKRSAPATWPP